HRIVARQATPLQHRGDHQDRVERPVARYEADRRVGRDRRILEQRVELPRPPGDVLPREYGAHELENGPGGLALPCVPFNIAQVHCHLSCAQAASWRYLPDTTVPPIVVRRMVRSSSTGQAD